MAGSDAGGTGVSVYDVRQYVYCPRIPYYLRFVHSPRPVTALMAEGADRHVQAVGRERRRLLGGYGLMEGERRFDVALEDTAIGLRGRVDLVILTPDEAIPVEYKSSAGGIRSTYRYQLAAYGLLVERQFARAVRRGFVYTLPGRRTLEVELPEAFREEVRRLVGEIRLMLATERYPVATPVRGRCRDCEFWRHCADVWRPRGRG